MSGQNVLKSQWHARLWPWLQALDGLLLPLGVLVVWELAARAGWISVQILPAPSTLASTAVMLFDDGALVEHIRVSVLRVTAGFAIGTVLALLIGAVVGLSTRVEAVFDPTFQALRAIPSLAWVPMLLLWFGVGEVPKVTLIAIGSFFPVYVNLVAGMRNVDRKLVEVGEIHGFRGLRLVARVYFPAALPGVFTGFRTGLSLAWSFLVAAELIAATQGVGFLLTDGRETGRVDVVIVSIFVLAVLGKLSDGLLRWLEQWLLEWRDTFENSLA